MPVLVVLVDCILSSMSNLWQSLIMPSCYRLIQTQCDSFALVSYERPGTVFAVVTERFYWKDFCVFLLCYPG